MGQGKLEGSYAVSEEIPQKSGCKKGNFSVYPETAQDPVEQPGDEGTCDGHGKGIGSQGGQAAVSQKDRLENQYQNPQNRHGRGPKQDSPQSCPRHMGAASADRGNFQGGDHKDKGP